MKNGIRFISSIILISALTFTLFSACEKNGEEQKNEISVTSEEVTVSATSEPVEFSESEKTSDNSSQASETTSKNSKTELNIPNNSTPPESVRSDGTYTYYYYSDETKAQKPEKTTAKSVNTTKAAQATEKTSEAKPSDKVEEISKGVSLITKTSPVGKGDSASIIIMGTPGAEYSIEFYESSNKAASYSGLENKKADSSGVCSWTFKIGGSCEKGERKIIIKEKNSDNYAQTSITVQ